MFLMWIGRQGSGGGPQVNKFEEIKVVVTWIF